MYPKPNIILVTCLAGLLVACSTTFDGYPVDPSSSVSVQATDPMLSEYLQKYFEASYADRRAVRDELVMRRMIDIDKAYEMFKEKLHSENVRVNAYTKWSTNLLEGSVPFVGDLGTAKGLSALSLFLGNGKEVYDNTALINSTMPAIISEMDTKRAQKRTLIIDRLKSDDIDYNIYTAWSDLSDYRMAGSVPDAIASINAKARDDKDVAEARYIHETNPATSGSTATDEFAPDPVMDNTTQPTPEIYTPPPTPHEPAATPISTSPRSALTGLTIWADNAANFEKLFEWLKAKNLHSEITNVIESPLPKYVKIREDAIRELNIN